MGDMVNVRQLRVAEIRAYLQQKIQNQEAVTMTRPESYCVTLLDEVDRLTKKLEREQIRVKRLRRAFWEWVLPGDSK